MSSIVSKMYVKNYLEKVEYSQRGKMWFIRNNEMKERK